MSEQGLQRPSQVTVAGGLGAAGALIFVLALFDTIAATRSVGARDAVAELLTQPPYDGMGVTVDELLQLTRVGLMVMGAVAAIAFVLAIYVFQRHNAARIGFTIAAVLMVPGMLGTMGLGLAAIMMAVAAVGLWSAPARDWFAGRSPRPEPSTPEPAAPQSAALGPTPLTSQEQPPPATYPFGSPTPPQAPAAAPQQQPPPYAAPPPVGWPPPPQGFYPPAQLAVVDKRPASVVWAAILTWVTSGLVAMTMALALVLLATSQNDFRDRVQAEINADDTLRELALSADQVITLVWATCIGVLLWSLAAVVVAVFAYRRHSWARIVLAVSAVGAAMLSLVGILSIVSVASLVPAVATAILLFTRGANAWYSRRPAAPPTYHPPQGHNKPW